MPPEFRNLYDLLYHKEMPDEHPDTDESRQPLSCRITLWHHTALEFLANRWNMSKSGVAAQILETSLNSLLDDEYPNEGEPLGRDLQAAFQRYLEGKLIEAKAR